jgi:sulfur relay (sulfurtransferase) complex TusBCD TusD component (DsrE family)
MDRSALPRLALALSFLLHTFSLSAAAVWFGDRDGLHRIDTATNQVVASVPFEPAVAIAVNAADGSVWALSQSRLARLSEQGSVQFQVAVRDLGNGLGAPRLLVLNPNDGSVWAAFENRVLHFAATGALQHALPVHARDLAVAQDGSLWLLTGGALQQRDAAGALLRTVPAAQRLKDLALDDAGGVLWLAGEKELLQLSLSNPAQPLLSLVAPETTSGISIDLQSGDLWVIGQNGLFAYGRDGSPRVSRDLRDFNIANPQTLLFDFSSQAAWVGHQRGLTRVTVAGTVAAAFPAAPHVLTIAIGRTPLNIEPVVSIAAPADGALLNTATPELRVDYDALCGAIPCGFPISFFSTFTLSAFLNGTDTGSSFIFDPATGGAAFTPATPLPEGLNTFSARARDSFGRVSGTVSSSFTVDTIAPSFADVTPVSGSVVSESTLIIAGSVDDPAATVTLGSDAQGSTFSFTVTLVEGSNTFTLTVRDEAGNTASLPLTYVYEKPNVPPSVAVTSPAAGTTFNAPASFTVTADATDSDGSVVRVDFFNNGVLAGFDTTAPYTADLANLATGSYTLTAQATDDRGGVTTSTAVSVTVGAPNALPVVQLTVTAGNPPLFAPAAVQVAATASDSDGTVVRVEFLRNGVVESTDTTAPYAATLTNIPAGTHTLTARATDDRGGVTTSAAATVAVTTPSIVIDSPLAGSAINADNVVVQGRITAPAFSGVHVNGYTAAVDATGRFFVLIPIAPGANTVTASLVTPARATATQSVQVNASGMPSLFGFTASTMTGFGPVTVTFTVSNPTAANAVFTFNGFGPFSLPSGTYVQFTSTYQPGAYAPTVLITANGTLYTHRLVLDIRDRAQMDQMFRSHWSAFNAALAAGDKAAAMSYLSTAAQDKYGPVLDALLPFMPEIVASYSPLEQVSITNGIAEYAVTRLDAGVKRLYLIYFLRDANGIWRIDGM